MDWNSLTATDKTWASWKTTFRAHQISIRRKQRATGQRDDVFGSASAAISIHGITDATPGADGRVPHPLPTPPPAYTDAAIDLLEYSALDNMAVAVTNKKAFLDCLVASDILMTCI